MIHNLSISYPDFQLNTFIDPEQFDTNNTEIVNKINELIETLHSDKAGEEILIKAIADVSNTSNLQTFLESLKTYIDTADTNIKNDVLNKYNTLNDLITMKSNYNEDTFRKISDSYTKQEVDSKDNLKANITDVYAKIETYNKSEIDGKDSLKANKIDVYTKTETYNKIEVDNAFTTHNNSNIHDLRYYTKQQIDGNLSTMLNNSGIGIKIDIQNYKQTTTEWQTRLTIPSGVFDKTNDLMYIQYDGVILIKDIDYTNPDNTHIDLVNPAKAGITIIISIIKKVWQKEDLISGRQLENNSVDLVKLEQTVQDKINKIENILDIKTYSELKTLKDNGQLKEGKKYLLTDYATKYKQPGRNVIKEMEIEQLILTASSNNTFEPIVYSFKYSSDTIWYDFDNNKCEDTTTPRNGFILRRYDSISGNDCPQDWRTMLWARWKPDVNQYYKNNTLTNYSVWTSGNAIMGIIYKAGNQLLVAKNTNTPSKADDNNVFDVVYNDTTIGILRLDKTKVVNQTSNKLELQKGELHECLTFGNNSNRNTFGHCTVTLHNNVFGDGCYNNSFGNDCNNNSFGNSCYNNSFGNSCCGNIFGNGFQINSFDNNCNNNSFGNGCTNNSFGNSCYNNSFGNYFYVNSFSNNCINNSFSNGCYNNSFSNNCINNSFGDNCYLNTFGNTCYGNIFGNGCQVNSFDNNCNNNSFGNGCIKNSFSNGCYANSFSHNCQCLLIKALQSKNLTSLDIYNKPYNTNIEKNNNDQYVFWYINSSNQPVYTVIP